MWTAEVIRWAVAAKRLPSPSLGLSQTFGLLHKPVQLTYTAQNSCGKTSVRLAAGVTLAWTETQRVSERVRNKQLELRGCGGMEGIKLSLLGGGLSRSVWGSCCWGSSSLFRSVLRPSNVSIFKMFAKQKVAHSSDVLSKTWAITELFLFMKCCWAKSLGFFVFVCVCLFVVFYIAWLFF